MKWINAKLTAIVFLASLHFSDEDVQPGLSPRCKGRIQAFLLPDQPARRSAVFESRTDIVRCALGVERIELQRDTGQQKRTSCLGRVWIARVL